MVEYDEKGRLAYIRELTDEEYEQTYASGSGGHELPPEVLAMLERKGGDDGDAAVPTS